MSILKVPYHGFTTVVSKDNAVGPYFTNQISHLIHKKRGVNVVITGPAGIGKSYMAMDICRILEGRTKQGKDRFTVDQVVFTYTDFMELVLKLPSGKPIVFDEPSYAMGKREWYKELNAALTKTIESFRFKVHPLFIPIINISLLDKTIRDYLIQYQVNVKDRGKAVVYSLDPSPFQDKTYHSFFCELYIRQLDQDLCTKPSCLGCSDIETCQVFRAAYERKKASIQESRYEQAKDRAQHTETAMKTINELEALAISCKDQWFVDGKIHIEKLRTALQDTAGASISHNRAYSLKSALQSHHQEFSE